MLQRGFDVDLVEWASVVLILLLLFVHLLYFVSALEVDQEHRWGASATVQIEGCAYLFGLFCGILISTLGEGV